MVGRLWLINGVALDRPPDTGTEGEDRLLVRGFRLINRRRVGSQRQIPLQIKLRIRLALFGDGCEKLVYVNEFLFSH